MKRAIEVSALVAALVAMAVPAAASAANWKHEGAEIAENKKLAFTGKWGIIDNFECPKVKLEVTLEPGATGTVDTFEVENVAECKPSKLFLEFGCTGLQEVKKAGAWKIHDEANRIGITGIDLEAVFAGAGPCNGMKMSYASMKDKNNVDIPVTATPNQVNAIGSVKFGGNLKNPPGLLVFGVFAEMNVLAPDVGTYGL